MCNGKWTDALAPQAVRDTTNDVSVTARVYQGVWDYEYSVSELAAHLGETPRQIEERLAQFEREKVVGDDEELVQASLRR